LQSLLKSSTVSKYVALIKVCIQISGVKLYGLSNVVERIRKLAQPSSGPGAAEPGVRAPVVQLNYSAVIFKRGLISAECLKCVGPGYEVVHVCRQYRQGGIEVADCLLELAHRVQCKGAVAQQNLSTLDAKGCRIAFDCLI